MWLIPSSAEWTIKKPTLRDTVELNRSFIVQRETVQCCVCAARNTTQSHFLLLSLLFGPAEKVATQIAFVPGPTPTCSFRRLESLKVEKWKTPAVSQVHGSEMLSVPSSYAQAPVAGAFISPSKGLPRMSLNLVNHHWSLSPRRRNVENGWYKNNYIQRTKLKILK